jgi:TonB family protein
MFEVLLASAQPRTVKPGRLLGSFQTHVLTIGLIADASRTAAENRLMGAADPVLILMRDATFAVREPEKPAPSKREVTKPKPKTNFMAPAPKGFQTVVAPRDIPFIPPIDLNEKPFDPRDYTGRGVEGGTADGIFGGGGIVATDARGRPIYAANTDDWRFQQAALVSQPQPRYPAGAASLGLSGRVLLRFVIDTTGRVDKRSIQLVENTDEIFVSPAREAVARAVFRPARMSGHAVRQLAEQSVRFVVVN